MAKSALSSAHFPSIVEALARGRHAAGFWDRDGATGLARAEETSAS